MKQLFICQNKSYATSSAVITDLTTVPEGTIALFDLVGNSLITSSPSNNFAIAVGRGTNKMPLYFPEVDIKSLSVVKTPYAAGSTFTATISVGTPVKGEIYTIVVIKKGTVFNERSNWTFTHKAKSTTAKDLVDAFVASINANKVNLGVTATAASSNTAVTITANAVGDNYEVVGADALLAVVPTSVTQGKKAVCDKAYIQDLASRCAAGKGFNYLGEDGKEIYPGYPEVVEADSYTLYTLRFAVPREASKQRDEVVYQLVHIAVPTGAGAITTLDTIFGTSTASSSSED